MNALYRSRDNSEFYLGEMAKGVRRKYGRLLRNENMSHESILYGYIEGAPFNGDDYRKYQIMNLDTLRTLPDADQFPYLTRGMFSAPELETERGTFQTHIIHFGGSMNGLDFGEVPTWITKFEDLLRRLYWFEAAVHILTDYIDGAYHFQWSIHREVLDTYHAGKPEPTTKWIRSEAHGERRLPPNE